MRAPLIRASCGLVFGLFVVLGGCKSTGSGSGESTSGDVQAQFTWEQTDPSSGSMTATLTARDGSTETYQGKFFQITSNSTVESLGPLWYPWHPGWGGWAAWGPEPNDAFITHYTGHVLANLAGPDRKRMRCEFQLLRAGEGMKGGGEGQCQLASGRVIKADFPPS